MEAGTQVIKIEMANRAAHFVYLYFTSSMFFHFFQARRRREIGLLIVRNNSLVKLWTEERSCGRGFAVTVAVYSLEWIVRGGEVVLVVEVETYTASGYLIEGVLLSDWLSLPCSRRDGFRTVEDLPVS